MVHEIECIINLVILVCEKMNMTDKVKMIEPMRLDFLPKSDKVSALIF